MTAHTTSMLPFRSRRISRSRCVQHTAHCQAECTKEYAKYCSAFKTTTEMSQRTWKQILDEKIKKKKKLKKFEFELTNHAQPTSCYALRLISNATSIARRLNGECSSMQTAIVTLIIAFQSETFSSLLQPALSQPQSDNIQESHSLDRRAQSLIV